MATITASFNVIPNEATPKGRLWLSESDQVVRWSHTPTIYIYKQAKLDHADIVERMRDSLSKILVHYYPLAGRLISLTEEGGRLELDCNAKGVTLLVAESTNTFADFGDFSPKDPPNPINDLIPKVDYTQPIQDLPLLLVQLTRFRGHEGLAIGVALSHPLADGVAAIRFINSWAKLARGDTLDPDEMPFLDRTILKSPDPPLAPRFDHPELKPLPLVLGRSDSMIEQKKKTTSILLKLTSEQVEKLKKKANDQSLQPKEQGKRGSSKFEAIAGHIWRCACKARELDDNQPTVVRFHADIRNRLNPPLPPNYFGNALAPTVTPTCYVGEIMSKPLSYAARKIREAVHFVTNEYIRSQLDFIRGQKQMDCMRPLFFERGREGEQRRDAKFYGNPNLTLTSWMSMPVYDADFGWGKPTYFGPGAVWPYDWALIYLSPDGDGSIIVIMHFQIAHMQLFKKFFYEDIATVMQEAGAPR